MNLERFTKAQEDLIDLVFEELAKGVKKEHYMWFVFPQLRGLGASQISNYFGIGSLQEAKEYLSHEILGSRLLECTRLVLSHTDKAPLDIFGTIDAMKFHSSMTLFHAADPKEPLFLEALERFYSGHKCVQTQWRLDGFSGLRAYDSSTEYSSGSNRCSQ